MLLPGWNMGRRIFPSWVWMLVVVAASRLVAAEFELFHQSSKSCKEENNTTLRCNVTDNTQKYRLDKFRWNEIRKVIIYGASHLELMEPLCSNDPREVEIYNALQVTTQQGSADCWQQVTLFNSTGVTIDHGVNLVRMFSSEGQRVTLPRVDSFILQDSWIGEVSLVVDENASITSTVIDVVKKLVIDEFSDLLMEDSSLGRIKGLIYNSTKKSVVTNVMVESVDSRGFMVQGGTLILDNATMNNVASDGLQVLHGATLTLQNCEIEIAVYDSILISKGNLYFKNVTVGQEKEIYLTFLDVNALLYPLAFMKSCPDSLVTWIVIAVVISLILGGLVGAAIVTFVMRRRASARCKEDVIKLHTTQHNTSHGATNYQPMDKSSTALPPRSPASVPKAHNTLQAAPTEQAPRPPLSKRPPAPLPHESSPKTSKDKTSATSSTVTQLPKTKNQLKTVRDDERDVLPSPPPPPLSPTLPDEELYDDVQGASCQNSNLIASFNPKLPSMMHRF